MVFWEFALMILYAEHLYYVFFIRRSEPIRIGKYLKHLIELIFLVLCWWVTHILRNDEDAWELIWKYMLLLLCIPVYNKFWNYPNFGLRDCSLIVSIQAAMFLTRSYTYAHILSLPIGFLLD